MTTPRKKALLLMTSVLGLALIIGVGLYLPVILQSGSARQEPPLAEAAFARWVVRQTVPEQVRRLKNPLDTAAESPDVSAGRIVFRAKCESCHAYNGSGKTEVSAGEYPRPLDLRGRTVQAMTDGELYFHIKNGIRHTGMPAWNMPDRQLWQLVAYLRHLPIVASLSPEKETEPTISLAASAHYVGSPACKECHAEIYARWKKTTMARVVLDPREHPEIIIPDLTKPDPLQTFTRDDIGLVYGSRWKQRYFKKVGDDYFVFPAQWDVTHKQWRPYFVKNGTDWWAPFYPPDNFQRPTGPLCDGCHSVNYDIATKKVTEWNVGCEKCHGPGSEHVDHHGKGGIVNPARLDYVHASDVCIQCHSQGRPPKNPIEGKYYDWPVGFHVGMNLSDFWRLEEHKLGETSFTHFADGTAHKNRMQGNDFAQSLMYTRGVACLSCHDAHGNQNPAQLWKPGDALCLDCHGPNTANGPHAATLEEHTHHKPGSTGSECVGCHMPKIAMTIADVNVRSHTFKFVTPSTTDTLQIPNACNACHTDKPTTWAAAALKTWKDRSPWRMEQ